MSAEIYFSNNYRDLCERQGTGAGFQFEFSCNRCADTWRSKFEAYTSGRMASWVGKGANAAWSVLGRATSGVTSAADGLAGAGYGNARDAAFQRAITNAEGHFNRCPRCTNYVCQRCWNADQGICLTCAPDTAAEALAAQQRGLNDMVAERAYSVGQQAGEQFDVNTPASWSARSAAPRPTARPSVRAVAISSPSRTPAAPATRTCPRVRSSARGAAPAADPARTGVSYPSPRAHTAPDFRLPRHRTGM